jgi:hypothetical protein
MQIGVNCTPVFVVVHKCFVSAIIVEEWNYTVGIPEYLRTAYHTEDQVRKENTMRKSSLKKN